MTNENNNLNEDNTEQNFPDHTTIIFYSTCLVIETIAYKSLNNYINPYINTHYISKDKIDEMYVCRQGIYRRPESSRLEDNADHISIHTNHTCHLEDTDSIQYIYIEEPDHQLKCVFNRSLYNSNNTLDYEDSNNPNLIILNVLNKCINKFICSGSYTDYSEQIKNS
jgi:hypothetical protein